MWSYLTSTVYNNSTAQNNTDSLNEKEEYNISGQDEYNRSEEQEQEEENNSPDFFYNIDSKDYITRALMFGATDNQYSSTSKKGLDDASREYIETQIKNGNGNQVLDLVKEIYLSSRSPKQDAVFMTHALLCRSTDDALRKASLEFLQEYRTISQLYTWKTFHATVGGGSKGFGRGVKRNLNSWILSKTPDQLAHQVSKYMKRGEWGISDLLKCIHTKTGTGDNRVLKDNTVKNKDKQPLPAKPIDLVLRYAVDGIDKMNELATSYNLTDEKVYKYLKAVDTAKHIELKKDDQIDYLVKLIQHFNLSREQVNTGALNQVKVQTALLVNKEKTRVTMPATALLRNLANLTRIGVFEDKHVLDMVVSHLKNTDMITKSYIHPVSVITAWFTYRKGHGKLSSNTWTPIPELTSALEEMFYLSFKNLTPTGKRLCFLIDASGSMCSDSLCDGISNAEIAALLAMVFTRAEANADKPVQHTFYLFTSDRKCGGYYIMGNTGLTDVSDKIHAKATFNDVFTATQRSDWGMTDISKGILHAKQFHQLYDGFVVITDNDVNSGIKPSLALQQYRDAMNVPAKMAIVATQLNSLSIADPSDKYMMDFCGFDSHLPKLLQEFLGGKKLKQFDE